MSTSYYDVVVLGTDLAPLTCAALLAKRGFRVAVLGQQTDRPDYGVGRFRLPRHPFTLTATHGPLARRIFAELGLGQSLRRLAHPLEPSFQMAMPGHRLDLPHDDAELEREIDREFPEVKRAILEFRRRIEQRTRATDQLFERDLAWPPDSLLERRELSRLAARIARAEPSGDLKPLGELPDTHPFRHAVLAPLAFSAHTDPASITELQLSRLFHARWRDAMMIEGGLVALNDLIVDKIRAHSGQLRFRERAQQILVKRSVACGVRLFGSDEEVGATNVIAGVDVAAVQRLLADRAPLEHMFERWENRSRASTATRSTSCWNARVCRSACNATCSTCATATNRCPRTTPCTSSRRRSMPNAACCARRRCCPHARSRNRAACSTMRASAFWPRSPSSCRFSRVTSC